MEEFDVVILIGSDSDIDIMIKAKETLDELGVACEMRITSAHRTPERTSIIVRESEKVGCKIFIAGAGMAAHLAGAVAAQTIKPVIGVPLTSGASPLGGVDALLSTVQMPPGMPVATMPINGAKNAALLAAQILAITDSSLSAKLVDARKKAADDIELANNKHQSKLDRPGQKGDL